MLRVGIVGVSGYGGGELARILTRHPGVELTYLSSETYKNLDITNALPNLRGIFSAECFPYDPARAVETCDIIFMAQHHGWAMKEAEHLLNAGIMLIDLSADFRLRDPKEYEQWYGLPHSASHLIAKAVYGLPEINKRKITGARLLANPGCYPTGAIIAVAPLLVNKLVDPDSIVIDSKSGVSGAGRSSFKLDYHFPELNESLSAYNVGVHRHTPEIEQELAVLAGRPLTVTFTPHLVPITRGILTTAYANLLTTCTTEGIISLYNDYYHESPFVIVLDAGRYPSTKHTFGSNFCHVGIKVDTRTNRVIVLTALDNLVKGMAGTAVQNMNLMYGFDERTALDIPGVFP